MGTKLITFFRSNAIALLALFVALGGTGYAAVKINGKNIKNGTIAGKKLKKHTLTGKQINLSKLGKVPSARGADLANNALALGGSPAASFLKTGCGAGKVNGYATIRGSAMNWPTTPTSSPPFIDTTFNCSGQAVGVLRLGPGLYDISFPGNPGTIGFGNVRTCIADCVAEPQPNVSVTHLANGAFEALVQRSGTSTRVDRDFDVLIP